MFAEHEYGFGYGLLLVCRFHGSYSVSLIKLRAAVFITLPK